MNVSVNGCVSVLTVDGVSRLSCYGSWDRLQASQDPDKDSWKRMNGWMDILNFLTLFFSHCIKTQKYFFFYPV